MLDVDLVVAIFSDLNVLVHNEPQLAAFIPAANTLLLQAQSIASGETEIPQIEASCDVPTGADLPIIANEALAKALRGAFDRLPFQGEDEEARMATAYRMLLRNAAVSVLFAISKQYPQLIPRAS